MIKVNFNPFPVLRTERLILRELTPKDAEDLYRLRSDERVLEHLDFPKMAAIQDALRHIEKLKMGQVNNEFINWVLCTPKDPKLMGTLVFWNISKENHRAETGYMLHPDFQGKGYMQEALAEVIDYGFHTMKLHSIEAVVNPANLPSTKLLDRMGFAKEGHFREAVFWNGKYIDSAVYSLISPGSKSVEP